MILPYLSIDLFFVGAFFLLRRPEDLRSYAVRIAAAILMAGAFFLVFPLRFAFPRPHASAWLGALIDWFRGMDAPYNLFPSLHAALWLLLLEIYARHLRGLVRLLVLGWLVLIGASPLLTHQTHVIDIIGGLLLALACRVFISRSPPVPGKDRAFES